MAILKTSDGSKTVSIEEELISAGRDLGIPFGCTAGQCGVCMVEVEEGIECLNEPNEEEKSMDLQSNQRLCCQMTFKEEGTATVAGV